MAQSTGNPSTQAIVRDLIGQHKDEGWDLAWQRNATPWDTGKVQPPLRDLLHSGALIWPKQGRALVPGCGRGCDSIFIATTLGLSTLAIDISVTAVKAANDLLASSPEVSTDIITFDLADFFKFSVPAEERFDLVYDYTFFVAIPPARRVDWGQQMNVLVKPGGYLVTLIFPIDPPQDYGPPFFVRPQHYVEVLGDGWEKVLDKIPEVNMESHVGREHLVVWKKL